MYSLSDVVAGLKHPNMALRELNRFYHQRLGRHQYNPDGVDVVGEDWDILVILDACRFDMFASMNTVSGDLESRTSRGSSTVEFLTGNFSNRKMHDTVYVTANPQLTRHSDRIGATFHDVVDVWRDFGWDEQERTVLPETMTEAVLEAAAEYEQKRLICHYVQPHYPFIGSDISAGREQLAAGPDGESNIWVQLMKGTTDTDPRDVVEAYRANLEVVLPHVQDLVDSCTGKVIITSDHGNLLGGRAAPIPVREWGHPSGIHVRQLLEVPWLVCESSERRSVTADSAKTASRDIQSDEAQERLKHLGYV